MERRPKVKILVSEQLELAAGPAGRLLRSNFCPVIRQVRCEAGKAGFTGEIACCFEYAAAGEARFSRASAVLPIAGSLFYRKLKPQSNVRLRAEILAWRAACREDGAVAVDAVLRVSMRGYTNKGPALAPHECECGVSNPDQPPAQTAAPARPAAECPASYCPFQQNGGGAERPATYYSDWCTAADV